MRKARILSLSGFTMTEVIVAIVMLGILIAAAVPSYSKAIRKARERDAIMQLSAIHATNSLYRAETDVYLPTGTGDLAAINSGLGLNIAANGLTYTYTQSGGGTQFQATAAFSDFTVRVTQASLSGSNPCCSAGSCPSLGGC